MQARRFAILIALSGLTACAADAASNGPLPDPAYDAPKAAAHGTETAVLAGGCFWGMQSVFEHVKGVKSVVAGYAGQFGAAAKLISFFATMTASFSSK